MPWTLYRSTDPDAPVLTGQAGKLVAVLDACLVNGYGSKAPAGWTKLFSETNRAVYQMGSGRLRACFWINDNAPHATALGREARVTGYEGMTGIDTGEFNLVSGGGYMVINKSHTTDATVRPWSLVADDRTFILLTHPATNTELATGTYFGEIESFLPNDDFAVVLISRYSEHATQSGTLAGVEPLYFLDNTNTTMTTAGHYLARDTSGLVRQVPFSKPGLFGGMIASANMINLPNPADGSVILVPVFVRHADSAGNALRGRLRGLWAQLHPTASFAAAFPTGTTFSGVGELAGRSFFSGGEPGNGGRHVLEISDTVPRN
jgi:hypothetical protein